MIKVENVEVFGWEAAIRGMRNPMNSWAKSDSYYGCELGECKSCDDGEFGNCRDFYSDYIIGENDLDLMRRLYKAGTEHRKYLRMIHVQMDITAPLYWWKEFDTYKVGTTANSCSTMHKIHAKEFTLDDFSYEHLTLYDPDGEIHYDFLATLEDMVDELNMTRKLFLETNDKKWWWQMIQLLPSSYNQRRTVDFNYETAVNMIMQRCNHKLDEWRAFVDVLLELPYIKEIMGVQS